MVKVVATSKGYFGGEIREIGASFVVPDDIWKDEKRRPSWVKLDPQGAFGGKGDHDGDGSVGGSKPGSTVLGGTALGSGTVGGEGGGNPQQIVVPADWGSLPAGERKALASKISGHPVTKAPEADKIIAEYVEATKPAPFSDAPPPGVAGKPEGNGVTEALGGPAPDWIAHEPAGGEGGGNPSGNPEQVDD